MCERYVYELYFTQAIHMSSPFSSTNNIAAAIMLCSVCVLVRAKNAV